MNISGNIVFIPGSTSGIGLALALELQARGNTVIVGGRRADLLEQIAADHPGIDTVQIDTTDAAGIEAAAKEVLARLGRPGPPPVRSPWQHTDAMEELQMAQYNERVDIVSNAILDAVRDVLVRQHVTHEEYQAALAWIDRLVQASETRMFFDNFFERTVEQVTHAGLPGSVGTIQGPYYLPGAPLLTEPPFVIPMREDEQGEPMVLSGEVLDLDGRPVTGALIELWQAGNDGTYSGFVGDAPRTNLRAKLHTDADGRFQIRTIRPAPYQIPTRGPVGRFLEMIGRQAWRPAHFHLKLSAEGLAPLTTQLYFRGGEWLEGDGDVSGAVKDPLIVDVVEDKNEQVARLYGIPTPFYSCSYTWQLRPADS